MKAPTPVAVFVVAFVVAAALALPPAASASLHKPQAERTGAVTVSPIEKTQQVQTILSTPQPASFALKLIELSTQDEPLAIRFHTGEWTGGVILTGDTKKNRNELKSFLAKSRAAKGDASLVSVGSSRHAAFDGALRSLPGRKFTGSSKELTAVEAVSSVSGAVPRIESEGVASSCTASCDFWVNNGSNSPSVPTRGKLHQFRMQGVLEVTEHEIYGLSSLGYPAKVRKDAKGNATHIRPAYIYEHDYKVKANRYARKQTAAQWESNLPGAYLDTDAAGLEIGNGEWIEYTVGATHTWLFDATKKYVITTWGETDNLDPKTTSIPDGSSAKLTASVIPNDGGRSKAEAALNKSGCWFGLVPPVVRPGISPQYIPTGVEKGDLAWCGGIGNFVNPSYVKNVSLIMKPPQYFPVRAEGKCYSWTTGAGYKAC